MQIALTKKLATAMSIKPSQAEKTVIPLFTWTANWINTFDRRKEDMIVMINNATRFTVIIYGIKRNNFKGIEIKMTTAIRNTLLAMNINPEIVDEYLSKSSEVEFVPNQDRKITAWLNHQGLQACFVVGRIVNDSMGALKFDDTWGHIVSNRIVNYSDGHDNSFVPAEAMVKALAELTGKPAYKYRAFELLATLDLDIYKVTRRMIVPADINFTNLHKLMQKVFDWKDDHLHDFVVLDSQDGKPIAQLVMNEEDLDYDKDAVLESSRKLSEYFPKYKHIIYTYDMSDNWEHSIEFIREIDEHNEESPFLLSAKGKTPPEDVGGVPGFLEFREIMLDESHPEYASLKEWSDYWSPELWEYDSIPRVIKYWF